MLPKGKNVNLETFLDLAQKADERLDELEKKSQDDPLGTHTENKNNPHEVTADQVGAIPINGEGLTDEQKKSARNGIGAANVIIKSWTAEDLS